MSQQSELMKGLVFRTKLDEWGQGCDVISGIMPTKTDVYNVQDRQGSGRRSIDCTKSGSKIILPSSGLTLNGNFTIIIIAENVDGLTTGAGTEKIWWSASVKYIMVAGTIVYFDNYYSGGVGKHIFTVKRVAGVITILQDGILAATSTGTNTSDFNYNSQTIGEIQSYSIGGIYSMCRIFNYSVDAITVRADGLTDLQYYSRPENPIKAVDRGVTTGANLVTNGGFTTNSDWNFAGAAFSISGGKANISGISSNINQSVGIVSAKSYLLKYNVSNYSTGYVRVSVSTGFIENARIVDGDYSTQFTAPAGIDGKIYFNCGGDGNVLSIDNASVVQLCCVLDLNAEGLSQSTSGYWYDRTNSTAASGYTSVAATNSGTTLSIPPASNLKAMAFNGTTSKVVFSNQLIPLGNTDRTFSVWVFPLIISGEQWIISYGSSSVYNDFSMWLYGDKFRASNYGQNVNGNTAITVGDWYNVVFTFASINGEGKLYINGTLEASGDMGNTNTILSNLYLGCYGGPSGYINALMENTNIWSRILSQDEIKLIYDTGF